jgi:hypothetical protein
MTQPVVDLQVLEPEIAQVAMHEKTFHQPEVKERIMTLFGKI